MTAEEAVALVKKLREQYPEVYAELRAGQHGDQYNVTVYGDVFTGRPARVTSLYDFQQKARALDEWWA